MLKVSIATGVLALATAGTTLFGGTALAQPLELPVFGNHELPDGGGGVATNNCLNLSIVGPIALAVIGQATAIGPACIASA